MLNFYCPWNDHVGKNSVKFSRETKARDGQADNNTRQRRRWQQRRIHRQETKEMEMHPRRRRRKKLSWKPYKKEKGIKSKIKLEDNH